MSLRPLLYIKFKSNLSHTPKIPILISNIVSDKLTISNTNAIYTIVNDLDINCMLYITMTSGGGAGGIGKIMGNLFISGSGGGGGSSILNKPLHIAPNQYLCIKLGKGGSAKNNQNGENSYLKLNDENNDILYELVMEGGKNGNPSICDIDSLHINYEQDINGGLGGNNNLSCGSGSKINNYLSGQNGCSGQIGIPSQLVAIGGTGGSSHLEKGGNGGGSFLCSGGYGGNSGNTPNIIGQNGRYGSGGGGSVPLSNHNIDKLSGDGGNSIAFIQICKNIF